MRIKQKPEDFSVKESYRFDEDAEGPYRVYMMDKQKLSTFDAIAIIRERFGLRPGSVSYCGLKDKQGRTEQLIAVDGADVDMQEENLRLKFLGRTNKALSSKNTTSNRFSVTVRALKQPELSALNVATAEVNRLGVINYFDSQRFGSLKHGQGFIAKDLLRGDFEAALRNYLAKPSPLDQSEDAKVKAFWQEHWGDWFKKCPFAASKKYYRIISALRDDPKDFVKAFLQIDSDYRALLIFTYQSYLWNEGVRRLLQLTFPREHLFPMPYQAGTLLFHKDSSGDSLDFLRSVQFPLLAPNSPPLTGRVKEAVDWVFGKEHLTLDKLRIEAAPRLLYFKHEERPVLIYPEKLVLGKVSPDELNKPYLKLNIAFTLPPGSYATLVVKRLFQASYSDKEHKHVPAEKYLGKKPHEPPARTGRGARMGTLGTKSLTPGTPPRSLRPDPAPADAPPRTRGVGPRSAETPRTRGGARTGTMSLTPDAEVAKPSKLQGFRARQAEKKERTRRARAHNKTP
jgi:tRNA pseudouridine13 synthase